MKLSLDKYLGKIISSFPDLHKWCNNVLYRQHRVQSYMDRQGRTLIIISHTRIFTNDVMMPYLGNIMSGPHKLYLIIISHTWISIDGAMIHYLDNILSGPYELYHICACIIWSLKDKSRQVHYSKPQFVLNRPQKPHISSVSLYHCIWRGQSFILLKNHFQDEAFNKMI